MMTIVDGDESGGGERVNVFEMVVVGKTNNNGVGGGGESNVQVISSNTAAASAAIVVHGRDVVRMVGWMVERGWVQQATSVIDYEAG